MTVGIGGNDVGLVGAAVTCAQLGLTAPTGHGLSQPLHTPAARIASSRRSPRPRRRSRRVLQGIHARSPLARVLLVGYPDVLPRTGNGCWPLVPLSPDDVRYFDGLIVPDEPDARRRRRRRTARSSPTRTSTAPATTSARCRRTRWFEGLVPDGPGVPAASQRARHGEHGPLGHPRPLRDADRGDARQAHALQARARDARARRREVALARAALSARDLAPRRPRATRHSAPARRELSGGPAR